MTLSKKRLDTVKSWEDVEQAKEDHTTVEGVVTEENKGGIVVSVKGVRVFVPASQSGQPRGADLSAMVKQKVQLRITEVNRARKRVVGSIRAVEAEERVAKAAEVWANIEEGKRYTGTVKSLTSYGAFVDIGGVDGMVHISELSWSRIKHPSEVVSVGDTVEVYVIAADKEKKKISLGMKDHSQDPWTVFTSTYEVGDVANVRVVKLMTFGAFAEIVPGVDGLIHISQIADHRIEKPGDVLAEGDKVDVKITDVDMENKKISLGYKKTEDNPWEVLKRDYEIGSVVTAKVVSMTAFGAFAQIIPGVDGLIHISQISNERINKPQDVLTIGQEVQVQITDIDFDKKRVSLSMKALLDDSAEEAAEEAVEAEEATEEAAE